MTRLLDVNAPVLNRRDEPMREPKTDARGIPLLKSGKPIEPKPDGTFDLFSADLMTIDVTVGMVINSALDKIDDKLTPEEKRKRFALALRIEAALKDAAPLSIEPDDESRIRTAVDALTVPAYIYRVHEALSNAVASPKVKGVRA